MARAGHAVALVAGPSSTLIRSLVPCAIPRLASRDAQTAVDIALQLRDHALTEQRGRPAPAEWSRFRDLAREFADKSAFNSRAIARGAVAGHCRSALVPLVTAACANCACHASRGDDVYAAVEAFAADLSEGRSGSAMAVAAIASTPGWGLRAARALLPSVCDLVVCALDVEGSNMCPARANEMEGLCRAMAAWVARSDTRVGAVASIGRLAGHVSALDRENCSSTPQIPIGQEFLRPWRAVAKVAGRAAENFNDFDAALARDVTNCRVSKSLSVGT